MQIFIRTIAGKVLAVDVEPEMTIAQLKEKIEAKHKIPIAELNLIYKGNKLMDTQTIDKAGISKEDTINIVKAPEGAKDGEIDLLIRSNANPGGIMKFKVNDTIEKVIINVGDKYSIDPKEVEIYYKGQRLERAHTIKEVGLKNNDTLLFVRQLPGGSL